MKKFFLLLSILLSSFFLQACDICGCGLGNLYIGMVPQFNRAFFGMRYQYRYFHTQIAGDKSQFSNDYFHTVELWGGFNVGRHLQVLAFVPYNYNNQVSDDGKKNTNGLGDISALINYSVLEKSSLNRNNKMVFQQLWFGAGIKAPTGSSQINTTASDIVALANSQLGSGSTDFLLTSAYTLRINHIGLTTNVTYKINTNNKENYRFGNQLSANNFFYYSFLSKKTTISPNLGISYEHSAANNLDHKIVEQTGGHAIMGTAGMEINIKKLIVGFNVQSPISQLYALGQTQTKFRGMMHVTFAF